MAVSLADEFVKVIPTAVVAAGTLAAGWGSLSAFRQDGIEFAKNANSTWPL
jgi:hypothetical protein